MPGHEEEAALLGEIADASGGDGLRQYSAPVNVALGSGQGK
jgi:hypothetical protein